MEGMSPDPDFAAEPEKAPSVTPRKGRFFRSESPDGGEAAAVAMANGEGSSKAASREAQSASVEPPKKKGRFFKESSPEAKDEPLPTEQLQPPAPADDAMDQDVKPAAPTGTSLFVKEEDDAPSKLKANGSKTLKQKKVDDEDDDIVMLNTPPKAKPGTSKANGKGKSKSGAAASSATWKEKYLGGQSAACVPWRPPMLTMGDQASCAKGS